MPTINIRYIVDDLQRCLHFYTDHLGFDGDMHPAQGFAALRRDNLTLLLSEPGADGVARKAEGVHPHPGGGNRMQMVVDDLESTFARVGSRARRGDIVEGRGGKQALIEDPSGNLIELFEPHERNTPAIPDGYHAVTPFLLAHHPAKLMGFLCEAFEAEVTEHVKSGDGQVRHATLHINGCPVMVSCDVSRHGYRPALMHLYVEDVDDTYLRALAAGAMSLEEPTDAVHGDRVATVEDPWRNHWWLATHRQDLPVDERKARQRPEWKAQRHTE